MEERHIGLTKAIADCFTEAACICLDRNHSPPQEFQLHSDILEDKALVEWVPCYGAMLGIICDKAC